VLTKWAVNDSNSKSLRLIVGLFPTAGSLGTADSAADSPLLHPAEDESGPIDGIEEWTLFRVCPVVHGGLEGVSVSSSGGLIPVVVTLGQVKLLSG
jgi:hypothetical protein